GGRGGGGRFERGGAVAIAPCPTRAQGARQLALRMGELGQSADALVRRQRPLEVDDRVLELPKRVREEAGVAGGRAEAAGGESGHDDGVDVRREERQQRLRE